MLSRWRLSGLWGGGCCYINNVSQADPVSMARLMWKILDEFLERNQDRVVWGGRLLSQQPACGGRPFPIRMRNIKDVMLRLSG